ncbi:MAG: AbrB/MazE/SpoVT family DNA-binding domain-containing protein, partial [Desulfitobacteriaceae bacterium]|nr:AbrB/MazE/SpoVT family DNA-binding domain-containing protein [Desulfitobacteriaceae bacterium]
MKALGIVRRIDDLGRVVIPKELRRTLKINESDALEIFTDERGEIILRKYSPVADRLSAFVAELARVLGVIADVNVIITDTDKVVTSWGNLAKRLTRGLPSLGPAIQCVLENGLPEEWSNINTDNEAQHLVDIHEGDYGDYPKDGSQYI